MGERRKLKYKSTHKKIKKLPKFKQRSLRTAVKISPKKTDKKVSLYIYMGYICK